MSENRDMGIEFGALSDDLEDADFPLTKDALLETYGDRELEHANGSTTVESVLGPEGPDEFETQDEVHQTILNMVGTGAVGRDNYSDRGGATPNEEQEGQGVEEGVSDESDQTSL